MSFFLFLCFVIISYESAHQFWLGCPHAWSGSGLAWSIGWSFKQFKITFVWSNSKRYLALRIDQLGLQKIGQSGQIFHFALVFFGSRIQFSFFIFLSYYLNERVTVLLCVSNRSFSLRFLFSSMILLKSRFSPNLAASTSFFFSSIW